MTTQLYANDYFGGAERHNSFGGVGERSWLINEVIKPELPNIIDNVEKCLELLNSEQSFRMPISNGAPSDPSAAYVRGIITRKGGFITDFQVMIKFKQFNRGKQCVYKMDTTKPFALEQVEAIKQNLETVSRLLESLQICEDVDTFAEDLAQVMQLLATSTNLLQYPPRELLFPYNKNLVLTQMFGSSDALIETNHHILSLDLVILYTEISMDFRNLRKVTTKPWCEFDPMTGTTFTDVVRDNLKSQRGKKLVQVLQDLGLHIEEPSLLRNMLPLKNAHNTTTLDEARDILARCVTFKKGLVSECEKVVISTSDPSLISITSKLNGLEACVSNYHTNMSLL